MSESTSQGHPTYPDAYVPKQRTFETGYEKHDKSAPKGHVARSAKRQSDRKHAKYGGRRH